MAHCSKCGAGKATKRTRPDGSKYYHCQRHGFIREIKTLDNVFGLSERELNILAKNMKKTRKITSLKGRAIDA